MSGPCTDCGGPDYQTLLARIAELEALSNTSVCIFCGETMEKDLTVMLDHAKGCGERPENRLMARIARLEAITEGQLRTITRMNEACVQSEAALAERDRTLRLAWFWHDRSPQHETFDAFLADLRARAKEGSE